MHLMTWTLIISGPDNQEIAIIFRFIKHKPNIINFKKRLLKNLIFKMVKLQMSKKKILRFILKYAVQIL